MKKLLFVIGIVVASSALVTTTSFAQNAKEATITYNKTDAAGYTANYNLPKEYVIKALDNYFQEKGFGKSSSSKGFTTYKGKSWNDITNGTVDVYYQVSGKKNNTTVNMMVSTGYDNYITNAFDMNASNNLINFLNTLPEKANFIKDLDTKEDALKALKKDQSKAQDNLKKLEKEKEKLEKEISDAKNKIQTQTNDIASKENELNSMRK